jgi:hypothetical protein
MPNPAYVKADPEKWPSEGVRVAEEIDLEPFDSETRVKIQTILDAMDWPQIVIFHYGESDRVVAPFVVGVSSKGNPLLRGYQLEGNSRSGKGAGWRVFQIGKMEKVENHQDFFNADDFDFDEIYPWIYKVFKML